VTTVRVAVDPVRCRGHGICALLFGEAVSLDEWGYAVVEPTAISDPRSIRRARRAVAACPQGALVLEDG